jgi:hypothetical protein
LRAHSVENKNLERGQFGSISSSLEPPQDLSNLWVACFLRVDSRHASSILGCLFRECRFALSLPGLHCETIGRIDIKMAEITIPLGSGLWVVRPCNRGPVPEPQIRLPSWQSKGESKDFGF